MISTLGSFVAELRAVGLPVSTAEALDAAAAMAIIDRTVVDDDVVIRVCVHGLFSPLAGVIRSPRGRRTKGIIPQKA